IILLKIIIKQSFIIIFFFFIAAAGPKLLTKDGLIQGLTLDKSYVFYGIPFADPPVAASRWKPPRPVTPWSGVYDATYPRAACMQAFATYSYWGASGLCMCNGQVSEDCLYLNVFVPLSVNLAAPLLKPLPVMLWIHGGDFIAGSASKQLYDGRYISNFTQTLVVSVAYRLGETLMTFNNKSHKHRAEFIYIYKYTRRCLISYIYISSAIL
uniref:Carboxylesterase type B domain-containing protein n=2 Tax=Cyprinus carpio TaxID=7962 RepID=A0A9R1SLD1_CYPCA